MKFLFRCSICPLSDPGSQPITQSKQSKRQKDNRTGAQSKAFMSATLCHTEYDHHHKHACMRKGRSSTRDTTLDKGSTALSDGLGRECCNEMIQDRVQQEAGTVLSIVDVVGFTNAATIYAVIKAPVCCGRFGWQQRRPHSTLLGAQRDQTG